MPYFFKKKISPCNSDVQHGWQPGALVDIFPVPEVSVSPEKLL